MNSIHFRAVSLAGALACLFVSSSQAAPLIINGGFESGFTGWTRADQLGSDGTFAIQSGTASPINAIPVPAPPGGLNAAMTDAQGPGSHVLYQDIFIPASVTTPLLSFQLYLNKQAPDYFVPNPASLDFSTPDLNQQFRVDIMTIGADPFSVAAADILQTIYQTLPGDPLVSGYFTVSVDLTTLLAANSGQTLRLRFADVDNVFTFNAGVDDVAFTQSSTPVPEPATGIAGLALLALLAVSTRKRYSSKMPS